MYKNAKFSFTSDAARLFWAESHRFARLMVKSQENAKHILEKTSKRSPYDILAFESVMKNYGDVRPKRMGFFVGVLTSAMNAEGKKILLKRSNELSRDNENLPDWF